MLPPRNVEAREKSDDMGCHLDLPSIVEQGVLSIVDDWLVVQDFFMPFEQLGEFPDAVLDCWDDGNMLLDISQGTDAKC